ncbi:CHRD domain-containing protein [candidate division KSB1 bacterium]|nr:MAG: CHRD domain-containing protein [candidate division KSB1 bacterium]MCE7941680.1 CHRD domain-containing protein [Chlorobi bacterium CHB1]MDL1877615.1 CHRD domain-containing protein [Cytophagia bacterium CHB2]
MQFVRRFLFAGLLCLGLALPAFGQNDHLLISEFVVTPTAGEFIEIYNPTNATVDLTTYYLTDDVSNNNNDYIKVVNGAAALAVANFDFLVKFPDGASIAPGGVKVIAFSGAGFKTSYAPALPDYEILGDDAEVPDMAGIVVTTNAGLTNGSESIVLFHWDGASDLVQDVDYVLWGSGTITAAVNKTGFKVDGPDADSDSSAYLNDTPVASQTVVNADNDGNSQPHTSGSSAARNALEAGETLTGGNGITGHDETSENFSIAGGSWTVNAIPTPGTVPDGLKKQPAYFMATLNGAQENPSVITDANGGGYFVLNADQTELQYFVSVKGLSGAIAASHFHNAAAGSNGPVVRNITFTDGVASGVWSSTDATQPLTPELLAQLLAGNLYVNVHTAANPGGEIRGQVLAGSEKKFVATLNGDQENPPVTTSANGAGKFTLNANGSRLTYDVTVSGLSGPITASHFHNAAAGVNGPVVRNISFTNDASSGVWLSSDATQPLTPALVAELLAGNLYVNVHTAANPGGEIRGQVLEGAEIVFLAVLNGAQENPPVATNASGGGRFVLNAEQTELSYIIKVGNLSGPITASHFHNAASGTNGPVVRNISFTDGAASGVWSSTDATQPLTPALLAELLAGNIYVNVHTAANPGGEIRGQLTSGVAVEFAAQVEGSQEVPPKTGEGAGFGLFTLNHSGDSLRYHIGVTGLSGPMSAAHFHNAPAGVNGGVVRNLTFAGDFSTGVWTSSDAQPLTPALAVELLASNIYVNVHTALNPGGEIRGQVLPGAKVVTPIGLARQLADNTRNVTIEGIITTVDFNLSSGTSSEFYLQDATGGIRMFVGSGKAVLEQGQRVRVNESTIATNAGRKNIETVPDSIVVIDTPGLPPAQVVTIDSLVNNRATLEGELVRINSANLAAAFPAENSNATITINDGSGDLAMFIDRDTDIDGSPTPPNPVNITGVATSFNGTPQIQPSRRSDFSAPVIFFAVLNGSQENPPVTTSASGGGMFVLNEAQTELSYNVSVHGLSGPITASHFHNAAAGVNGPVVRNITFTDGVASGVWSTTDATQPLTPELLAALLAGELYVNVHTAANPGGEIRGQVLVGEAKNFSAMLNGAQENPPVTTNASGTGSFTLNATGSELSYEVSVSGLSGPIAASHFHNAAIGVNGPVVRDIVFTNGTASGVWNSGDGQALTPALVAELLAGKIYVNVHTAANPGGEIRGQVLPGAEMVFHAVLNGAQENPAVTTNASGGGRFVLNADHTELSFKIKVANLSGPIAAAHFHNAAAGVNGPVVRNITFTDTVATGVWSSTDATQPLTPELLGELLAGNLYVNVHTAANPGGEIRGQVRSGVTIDFAANLDGSQENPPVTTESAGVGTFTLNAGGDELVYNISVTGFSSAFQAAHFHLADRGKNGPVVRGLAVTENAAVGVWKSTDAQPLTPDLVVELLAGQLYVNFHTANNPGGEIRGQVIPGAQAIMPMSIARQTANGIVVTVEGIVTRAEGRAAIFQDATAGLMAFQTSGAFRTAIDSGEVSIGDRLRVTGTLTEFNSLKEISPISSFEVVSRGNTLPAAQLVTLAEIASNGEAYESELIRIEGLNINRGSDTVFVAARTYAVTDASDQSGAVALRTPVASDTEIEGVAIPAGPALFEGVLGQFSSTNPTAGYQLSPILPTDVSPLTGVEEHASEAPASFALLQNYPNPFNPTTIIRYDLPKQVHVKIAIYNLLGKRVRTLVDAQEAPGFKQITWDGANDEGARVASGIYIYRIETEGFSFSRKMTLLK